MGFSVVAPFEIEDDHQSFILNFTGGIKAWQRDANSWSFGPVIYKGEPVMAGMLSMTLLQSAMKQMGLLPVVMEHVVCMDGNSTTMLRSVHPVKHDVPLAAADIWRTISGNITDARIKKFRSEHPGASSKEIMEVKEKYTPEENYSDYISDSLRSMDICIGAICTYYHEQLISFLRDGRKVGVRSSNIADLPFIANVHSFFVHLGATKDYLATLIAIRCGLPKSIDAMNRLVDKLKWENLPDDAMVKYLVGNGVLSQKEGSEKSKLSGWLNDVSNIRNELVHKRPYGSHEDEKMGYIRATVGLDDHYRFWKPLHINGNSEQDTLDFISDVYHKTTRLFGDLALASGQDAQIPTLTDKDILELKVRTGKPPKDHG